jgi:mRNA-degrading endonuclease HigB of HigAB toxin-antitoxin module
MPNVDINFLLSRLRTTPGSAKEERASWNNAASRRIFKKPPEIKELFTAVQRYCAIDYSAAGNA